ncbi:MAG: CAP domain-containing protein [Candidatus Pacebacteria bacterium]|nr:CAP domain-containing protein [Candidatus Paceibacterota bacterium]MBP9852107.1 CAP domain-containing protein [Candidatus Paceibacterota bacterium]
MRKELKHALIPHEGNGYKPTLFHFASISAVLVVGIICFIGSLAANRYILTTPQGAAVYSSVLVDLTNKARTENNAPKLAISDTLTKAAQLKADDMAARQYFSHTSPDGTTPWYWFQKAGYEFMYAGENLAVDFTESTDVENAWLASPKHRDNIVDSRFTEIGIATKTAVWQGRQTTFVVQLFGAPTRSLAVANADEATINPNETTNNVQSAATPTVAGAREDGEQNTVVQQRKVSVVSETPTMITVEAVNLGAQLDQSRQPSQTGADATTAPSLSDKAIVEIPTISNFALTGLAIIILLGLILFIFIEVKRQHPKHVVFGVFALFILSTLAYMSNSLTLPV